VVCGSKLCFGTGYVVILDKEKYRKLIIFEKNEEYVLKEKGY
jgi:hypothetical protein